jgi:tryptophan synthase beta chain
MFYPFRNDADVRLVGVESAGDGLSTGKHAATLGCGRPGVLHGSLSYLLQDQHGQVSPTHTISAGLDYPGVGPEHAYFHDSGRVEYVTATDSEAIAAFQELTRLEGIIPALESSFALSGARRLARAMRRDQLIVVNLSGRGDKDLASVQNAISQMPKGSRSNDRRAATRVRT